MEADPVEALQSLMGREIVDWGHDDSLYHVTLDDGRMLVFMGLGIVTYSEDVPVH